jgi:hypothetical protein
VSHSNRNFAIAYVFLVALPIAGLAGILRSGRNLKAPTSIDGAWSLQANPTTATLPSCMRALGFDAETRVAISQSGENFVINAEKIAGSGRIQGSTLRASLRPVGAIPSDPACGSDTSATFTATVDANARPRVLWGALLLAGCPSCDPVGFHATKQATTQKKGAQ